MQIPESLATTLDQLIGYCLKDASPDDAFDGRIMTQPIEGDGMLGVLAHDGQGEGDARSMGINYILQHAGELNMAVVVTDTTLTSESGETRDGAVIDLFIRGEPSAYVLVQFYNYDETGDARPEGNLALMAQSDNLLT